MTSRVQLCSQSVSPGRGNHWARSHGPLSMKLAPCAAAQPWAAVSRVGRKLLPRWCPASAPIARVDGVYNAVVAEADFAGRLVMEGRGAGAGPTASAVAADLIDIARGRFTPVWGAALAPAPAEPMAKRFGAYYLRLMVLDRPGVIADVTAILRDHAISLDSMLQRGRKPGEAVPVVLVTHDCEEAAMRAALDRIGALAAVLEQPTLIRIEQG